MTERAEQIGRERERHIERETEFRITVQAGPDQKPLQALHYVLCNDGPNCEEHRHSQSLEIRLEIPGRVCHWCQEAMVDHQLRQRYAEAVEEDPMETQGQAQGLWVSGLWLRAKGFGASGLREPAAPCSKKVPLLSLRAGPARGPK